MKFYDQHEAIDTLEAIVFQYDKRTLAEAFSSLAISSLKNEGSFVFKGLEDFSIIKKNDKYAIKFINETE
jgi:hypothetical protein